MSGKSASELEQATGLTARDSMFVPPRHEGHLTWLSDRPIRRCTVRVLPPLSVTQRDVIRCRLSRGGAARQVWRSSSGEMPADATRGTAAAD